MNTLARERTEDTLFDLTSRKRIVSLLDLTNLNDAATEDDIKTLCQNAQSDLGFVPCVCVFPRFIETAKQFLSGAPVKIATVVNFPKGDTAIEAVCKEIQDAIAKGADEIDMVFPYQAYLNGDTDAACEFIHHAKKVCGKNIPLKVILETEALKDPAVIACASRDAINAGADFLKTSTGKLPEGASLEAAAVMLVAIKQAHLEADKYVGFKVAGGVKTKVQALSYIQLAEVIMGREWVTPWNFRIGASSLLEELLDRK